MRTTDTVSLRDQIRDIRSAASAAVAAGGEPLPAARAAFVSLEGLTNLLINRVEELEDGMARLIAGISSLERDFITRAGEPAAPGRRPSLRRTGR